MLSPSPADVARSGALARPARTTSGARVSNPQFLAVLLLFGAVNVAAVLLWPRLMGDSLYGRTDWANLSHLSLTDPYANVFFRWSPPAAWIWVALIAPLGLALWMAMHFAALASLAASPYWLGYYLMFALLELADLRRRPLEAFRRSSQRPAGPT
jgi:hypothetical protein